MFRRIVASQLRTISSLRSPPPPLRPPFPRYFSAPSGDGKKVDVNPVSDEIRKRVDEINPIATGHEREELEAELQGRDILEIDHPCGPFGTKEEPAVIKSYFNNRIVGCPGGEGEDEHDVVWFWLEEGKPHVCPVCEQYFVLEVAGPGGPSPHGPTYPSDDEKAHH